MPPLPLLLAGPLVRRVETRGCSFFFALSKQARIKVALWTGTQVSSGGLSVTSGNFPVASAEQDTKPLGEALHVAVVTVALKEGEAPPLVPGALYSYNAQFTGAFGTTDLRDQGLLRDEQPAPRLSNVDATAPLHLALGYIEDRLPTFLAPPGRADQLRLAHTSCRKTNAPGYDALAWLDTQLQENFTNLEERPQQLYLTGDQIYADDLGACLLPGLISLGRDLLGREEKLPVDAVEHAATLANFPPQRRERLVRLKAGFTSTSGSNHLLSFGEFAAMYLCAFSPRVWRPLPPAAEMFTDQAVLNPALRESLTKWEACYETFAKWKEKKEPDVERERENVELFRLTVPKVARALANIATYMIMDDHEITDDWNLNARWRNRVFSKPLGKAVVRNGLMAYGVFQGWGNDPAAFGTDGANKDFFTEITPVVTGAAAPTGKLDNLCGIADGPNHFTWHYRVLGPDHVTAVLDTRTRRKLKGQGMAPPNLLGDTLDAQVPGGPFTDGRSLLLVVSPAPVLGANLIDRVAQPLAQTYSDISTAFGPLFKGADHDPCKTGGPLAGAEKYDAEGWSVNEEAQEQLFRRLAPHNRVIMFSGDVHFSSSLVLDYWRKGVDKPARIVQFTASAARNTSNNLVEAILRSNAFMHRFLQGLSPERLAWNEEAPIEVPAGARFGPGLRARMRRKPALVSSRGWPAGTTIQADKLPDWRWRLTVLRDERKNSELPLPLQQPFLTVTDELGPANAFQAYQAAASRHAQTALTHFSHLRLMVFVPNLGLVQVSTSNGALVARHTLLSQDAPASHTAAANTVHDASLAPTDMAQPILLVPNA